jgi:hypothetical protein
MALRMGALYDALVIAKVPVESAGKAAEEVASYENRLAKVEADLLAVKWMLTTVITLQLLTLGGMLGLVWRLVK